MHHAEAETAEKPEHQPPGGQGIDKVAIYQTVLRVLVYLAQKDYTEKRQTGVQQHDGLPNPASAHDSSQG